MAYPISPADGQVYGNKRYNLIKDAWVDISVVSGGQTILNDLSISAVSGAQLKIKYDNYDSGYGVVRFYESEANLANIHSFSQNWDDNSFARSAGALNLDSYSGVTIGGWDKPTVLIRKNKFAEGQITWSSGNNVSVSQKGYTYADSTGIGITNNEPYSELLYLNNPAHKMEFYTNGSQRAWIDAKGISVNSSGANLILGSLVDAWGEDINPAIYSSAADNWIMLRNPHIGYTKPGTTTDYAGGMTGSTARFAANPTASTYWDIGVGTNSVPEDVFSIGRAGVSQLAINGSGAHFSNYLVVQGHIESYATIYHRDGIAVLNSAGTDWNTWATRTANGNIGLGVESLNVSSTAIFNKSGNGINGNADTTLELYHADGPSIAFHRPGDYASKIWFGTDHKYHFGGWSDAADAGQIVAGNITSTGNISSSGEIYVQNWIRSNLVNIGLHNEATAMHWYSDNNSSYSVTTGNIGLYPKISLKSGHEGTVRGYLYSDTEGFGLLTNTHNWWIRNTYNTADTEMYGKLKLGGNNYIDFGPNSTWGAYLRVGGNGHTDNTIASVVTTNGNLHLDAASSRDIFINWYGGKDFIVGNGDSGTFNFIVYNDGRTVTPRIHNNSYGASGTTPMLASGTYTPTYANLANTSGVSTYATQWMRVGNVVTIAGGFITSPTTGNALMAFTLTLPISTASSSTTNGGGTAVGLGNTGVDMPSFMIRAVGSSLARFDCSNPPPGGVNYSFTYTYLIT